MALPLKSGADLYNNQALRLRLHNLGADPTEVGAGLIYFNTSSGLNTSQKARLYTGSAWKTIAFSEDLDVASNADFLALKDRVDLLSGDVDTDAIISNMKEVSAFLEGFAEDASLMDYLNTELGKKLDLTGGTIKGVVVLNGNGATNVPLNIATPSMGNTGYIRFGAGISANELGHLGFSAKGEPAMVYEGTVHPLLHSGNYSDYALPLSGGTINGNVGAPLVINTTYALSTEIKLTNNGNSKAAYVWDTANGVYLYSYVCNKYIGIKDNGTPHFTGNTLLHSGNVGEYALKTDGSNAMQSSLNMGANVIAWGVNNGLQYLGTNADGASLAFFGNGFSDWKTIAFTDSNVASATKLKTARTIWGQSFDGTGDVSGAMSYVENINFVGGWMEIGLVRDSSNAVQDLIIQANGGKSLSINPNGGNVLIGTTTDNGAELQVAGSSTILGALSASTSFDLNRDGDNGNIFNSERAAFEIETLAKTVRFRTFNPNVNNVLTFYGSQGNVGIGKIAYTHKLEVEGNVHISGSLIVDGEVSAGGAGTEGGNAGGGGAFHSESIGVGATQTTIAHGLGTDDIVVSIYEKDGVSGRWSLILTDVEIVDANNIIVSFGSATSVEHKVVIMGAVA